MLQRKKQRQIQRKWPATFCVAQRRSEGASPPMQTLYFQIRRCLYAEMKIQRWRKTNTRTMTNNVLRITRMEPSQSLLDFAGQWQRQRQTQRKYENNDLRYTASHKEKGSPPICIMQVLYFQIRPYFWTAIINTKTLAYKSWFLCTPRIASAPLSTSPPGVQPMTFGAASHPHMPICYVKQLKVAFEEFQALPKEIYPEKPKNKICYLKHTKPNLSDQNLPIQTYHT